MAGARRPDLAQPGTLRLGPAKAVEAAPIGTRLLQALAGLDDTDTIHHLVLRHRRERQHDWQAARFRDLQRRERLSGIVEGLADDDVGTLLDGPADHLLEHGPDFRLFGLVLRVPDIGVRDIAGHQIARLLVGNIARDLQGRTVERLQQILLADHPHLLAMTIIGEGLDDIAAGALEIDMKRAQRLRMLQRHLGHEFASGQIAAALQFEKKTFDTDYGACIEAFPELDSSHGSAPSFDPSVTIVSLRASRVAQSAHHPPQWSSVGPPIRRSPYLLPESLLSWE